MKLQAALLATAVVWTGAVFADPATHYQQRCAACHDQPADAKTPPTDALRRLNALRIRHAVLRGKMREYTEGLSRGERVALAEHLVGDQESSIGEAAFCAGEVDLDLGARIKSWGYDSENSRWQRQSAVNATTASGLTLKWAFGVPNVSEMRSQPVVTADTIFLATVGGRMYALDRDSGCIKWTYRTDRPLRTSLAYGHAGERPALFVGDQGAAIHAVDAANGALIWRQEAGLFDASVTTGAPVQHGDVLFVPISAFGVALAMQPRYECCKSHGGVRALNAADGTILWTTHMTADAEPTYLNDLGVQMWGPSGAAVWTTPAIDAKRGVLYVGTGENTSSPATELSDAIVALSLATGEIQWHFQGTANDAFNMACGRRRASASCPKENGPDFDFGASVIIARDSKGKDVLLAGQKSGSVFALDPDAKGEVIWHRRIGPGSALGGVHWGIAADERNVYVPIADPPSVRGNRRPGVWALSIDDGSEVWGYAAERGCTPAFRRNAPTPWPECSFAYTFSAAVSIAGDVVLAGALDGRAFAFDSADGSVLWEHATSRDYETVNGVAGHGGAIDSPGIVAADDLVIVPSGYGMFGQMPGNVLLVFEIPRSPQAPASKAGAATADQPRPDEPGDDA